MDKRIAGIDVAKEWLDIVIAGENQAERIANDGEAVGAWLDRERPELVAFEPTGGYERLLQRTLLRRGVGHVRVHPNDIVAFRKSRGIKAKTDRLDARLIAAFAAEELSRRGFRPPIVGDEALRELAARRRQLVDVLHAERCRLGLAQLPAVRRSLEEMIDTLAAQLAAVEDQLAGLIAANPAAAELAALFRTVKGVGPVTSMTLLADLPEIGHLNGKQIAALTGLAPRTRQSGKTRSPEPVAYGRPSVRRVLFNAGRAAISHPSPWKDFFDRLVRDNGRPGKVALVAVMRKMLVTLNAIARDRQPWRLADTAGAAGPAQ